MSDHTILPERRYLHIQADLIEVCPMPDEPQYCRVAYRITMTNAGKLGLRMLGRKWIIHHADDTLHIIEAEHVFGSAPLLMPGEVFSFGGYRNFKQSPERMELRIFGVDQMLVPFVSLPCIFPKKSLRISRAG